MRALAVLELRQSNQEACCRSATQPCVSHGRGSGSVRTVIRRQHREIPLLRESSQSNDLLLFSLRLGQKPNCDLLVKNQAHLMTCKERERGSSRGWRKARSRVRASLEVTEEDMVLVGTERRQTDRVMC